METPTKTAQELWITRVINGTWTPEYLVPEMQQAAKSAAAAVAEYKRAISGS
jgi:hypothetical protein